MVRIALALALVAAAVGCSDSSSCPANTAALDGSAPDLSALDFTTPAQSDGAVTCGTGIYPCGPYGHSKGDVAENLSFVGFMDAKNNCTTHADKKMDTSRLRKISFQDLHLVAKGCEAHKRKLLWLMISAGWCGPCKLEVQATQKQYAAGGMPKEVEVINVLYEDAASAPVSESFAKSWIGTYGITFPVALDPSFRMGAYFTQKAVPYNMLIETQTMKVLYQHSGYDQLVGIGKEIQEYLSTH